MSVIAAASNEQREAHRVFSSGQPSHEVIPFRAPDSCREVGRGSWRQPSCQVRRPVDPRLGLAGIAGRPCEAEADRP